MKRLAWLLVSVGLVACSGDPSNGEETSAAATAGTPCGGLEGKTCGTGARCALPPTDAGPTLGQVGTCVAGTPKPGELGATCGSGIDFAPSGSCNFGLECASAHCAALPLFPGELGGICSAQVTCKDDGASCDQGMAGVPGFGICTGKGPLGAVCGGPAGEMCSGDLDCRSLGLHPGDPGVCVKGKPRSDIGGAT